MSNKPNAIYIMGGGGTSVMSASAYGVISATYEKYRDKVGTFYSAVGGMRGALNEDFTDVFAWAQADGESEATARIKRIKFPAAPVFGTSRHKPNDQDCIRLLELFKAHNIEYVFLNGGNDTMEKSIILANFAKEQGVEIHVIGIPKTVDNDLLGTHRCPGFASFAKQVALNTISLQGDLDSFGFHKGAIQGGSIREGGVAQIVVFMGRDHGWGAAASVLAKLDDSYGPHVILTKEGGFYQDDFLNRCQNAWDTHGRLLVVASEGAFDTEYGQYLGNRAQVMAYQDGLLFNVHRDPHKNTSVTDSRVALFLKLLLESKLKMNASVYKSFKCREEGPAYLNRCNQEILSAVDFQDAINVGSKAADLAFGGDKPVNNIMVTLTHNMGETGQVDLTVVADTRRGSKDMTKPLTALNTAEKTILSNDGMMVDKELFEEYIGKFVDLNGPNRREILSADGYALPLPRIDWPLEARKLPAYDRKK